MRRHRDSAERASTSSLLDTLGTALQEAAGAVSEWAEEAAGGLVHSVTGEGGGGDASWLNTIALPSAQLVPAAQAGRSVAGSSSSTTVPCRRDSRCYSSLPVPACPPA